MVGPEPLVLGQSRIATASGPDVVLTRWDVILSGVAFHRPGGGWITRSNWVAVVQAGAEGIPASLAGLPAGAYDRVRFHVGLPTDMNQRDAATWPPDHPLNPARSGLHWGWMGGWVFAAIEGHGAKGGPGSPAFSFHIATDAHRATVEQALAFTAGGSMDLEVVFDAQLLMGGSRPVVLDGAAATTHSRQGDPVAAHWAARHRDAVRVVATPARAHAVAAPPTTRTHATAVTARPFVLVIPATFPRPSLPEDNPLTEEGVALGSRLFRETLLSGNQTQSCATCHDPARAFTDGRATSLGSSGQAGTRNAMPLFNLAWKSSFFWDGRARTLREQVLQPITNAVEMAASLPTVIARLSQARGDPGYPEAFRRAFGTPEMTPDRVARALEQFLLVQVSGNSRFDRALRGEVVLTASEARGWELFRTEFDPVRGLRGADCFHCHGGSLFQSQRFGNNGLTALNPRDRGRAQVTGMAAHEGLFAVPSLRNVSRTGPYMHDGRFQSLAEVVAHYSHGVTPSPTLDPNLAKHPGGGLGLDEHDQAALVAFLTALEDDSR